MYNRHIYSYEMSTALRTLRKPGSTCLCIVALSMFSVWHVLLMSIRPPTRQRGRYRYALRPVANDLLKTHSGIGQWAVSLGRHVLVTFSEQGTNKPLGLTESCIKSHNSTAFTFSFVERIHLKFWHDTEKCVVLIVTKFGSETMSHFNLLSPSKNLSMKCFLVGSCTLLTHWGRVTHICVGKLTSIGSDNGLPPIRRQAIIWTNAGVLLIGRLRTNFIEIFIESLLSVMTAHKRGLCRGVWFGTNVLW